MSILDLYKSSIVLRVLKADENGETTDARVTLNNVRSDLTTAEIKQLINAFQTLISHQVAEAQLVQYSHII